jgi:hypothetical protein
MKESFHVIRGVGWDYNGMINIQVLNFNRAQGTISPSDCRGFNNH